MLSEIALIGYSGPAHVVWNYLQDIRPSLVGYIDLHSQETNPST